MESLEPKLAELVVLVVDAQATSCAARGGELLELGWAPLAPGHEPAARAHVVAPSGTSIVPRAVERLTGLSTAEWRSGTRPDLLWARLLADARASGDGRCVPLVIHYARFEEPFLRGLHAAHGPAGEFPLLPLCTHAIARRLLPELPRCTLRALAGYFGAAVPPLRRSMGHVVATALVWRHLVPLLAEREGVLHLAQLQAWLARPARRAARRFALPAETRRRLPTGPGVYRMLRAGGAVLYVGKAASLRTRVGSHFHARAAHERSLEMLTQVREVSCTQTATALEAAVLEADEIKRLAPPYNVALLSAGRGLCFASTRLDHLQPAPDPGHPIGPLASPAPIEALQALRLALADPDRATCVTRARAVGVEPPWAPGPESFAVALARFAHERGRCETARGVERLGRRWWRPQREGEGLAEAEQPTRESGPRAPAWDAATVTQALERTLARAAHAIRRASWLLRLSECSLGWTEPATDESRLLVIEAGAVVRSGPFDFGSPLPSPDGYARSRRERLRSFDVASFDRLRVLTTELRTLALRAPRLQLRLGPRLSLSRLRLAQVLRWI